MIETWTHLHGRRGDLADRGGRRDRFYNWYSEITKEARKDGSRLSLERKVHFVHRDWKRWKNNWEGTSKGISLQAGNWLDKPTQGNSSGWVIISETSLQEFHVLK